MSSNLPPGVYDSDPYFNPPQCDNCGEECTPGEDCEACGEYVMTEDDYAEIAAERKADAMRDGDFDDPGRDVW